MDKNEFTRALTNAAHNMPSPSKDEKEAIEGLLNDAFNVRQQVPAVRLSARHGVSQYENEIKMRRPS